MRLPIEATGISAQGIRLVAGESERCLSYEHFPWLREASAAKVFNVEEVSPHHYHWPDLDVDLTVEMIEHPERFPLRAK